MACLSRMTFAVAARSTTNGFEALSGSYGGPPLPISA